MPACMVPSSNMPLSFSIFSRWGCLLSASPSLATEPQKSRRHLEKKISIGEGEPLRPRWIAILRALQPPSMHPHFDVVNSGICGGKGKWRESCTILSYVRKQTPPKPIQTYLSYLAIAS